MISCLVELDDTTQFQCFDFPSQMNRYNPYKKSVCKVPSRFRASSSILQELTIQDAIATAMSLSVNKLYQLSFFNVFDKILMDCDEFLAA